MKDIKTYFSSDFHLGRKNILKYDNRPFESIELMNETIISNLESLLKKGDNFYYLGDLSFEKDLSKEKFIRVHKSYIINIDKVERFNSKFAEIGVTKIPLSRNKKEDLIKALAIA